MAMELMKDKYLGAINTVEIGVGPAAIKVGGETAMPFLFEEGAMPYPPVVAYEITDVEPAEWSEHIKRPYGDAVKDPVKWAKMCVSEFGAKILCVRLIGIHPEGAKRPAEEVIGALRAISKETRVPLIIIGCQDIERDNEVLPKISQAMKGENCLVGIATQNNYKTLAAILNADGHSIIAESPIDINIAKQLNILIGDMGFDPKKIVMHPTTTSLGYGMEYVYSIMERARLASFIGDKTVSMPFVLFVGSEVWRTKEAKEGGDVQGANWEAATAVSMIQAGADIVVMRHPQAIKTVSKYIEMAMKK